MQSLRVSQVHLVRTKKLKSGKNVVRSLRTIHNPKTILIPNGSKTTITVDIDHKWAAIEMVGAVDRHTAVASMDTKSLELRGYLQGRGFKVVGYNFTANITNVG